MNCKESLELMSLYIDNEITEEESDSLLNHIKACPSCKKEFEEIKKIVYYLNNEKELELPEGFHEELLNKIKEIDSLPEQNEKIIPLKTKTKSYFRKFYAVAAIVVLSFITINGANFVKNNTANNIPDFANIYKVKDAVPETQNNESSPSPVLTENGIAPSEQSIPEVSVPNVSNAKISVPEASVPEVSVPKASMPQNSGAYNINTKNTPEKNMESVSNDSSGQAKIVNQNIKTEIPQATFSRSSVEDEVSKVQDIIKKYNCEFENSEDDIIIFASKENKDALIEELNKVDKIFVTSFDDENAVENVTETNNDDKEIVRENSNNKNILGILSEKNSSGNLSKKTTSDNLTTEENLSDNQTNKTSYKIKVTFN